MPQRLWVFYPPIPLYPDISPYVPVCGLEYPKPPARKRRKPLPLAPEKGTGKALAAPGGSSPWRQTFRASCPCLWASCGMVAAAGAGWCRTRPEAGRQPGTVIVLHLPDFMSDMSGTPQVKPAIPTFFTARHETTLVGRMSGTSRARGWSGRQSGREGGRAPASGSGEGRKKAHAAPGGSSPWRKAFRASCPACGPHAGWLRRKRGFLDFYWRSGQSFFSQSARST